MTLAEDTPFNVGIILASAMGMVGFVLIFGSIFIFLRLWSVLNIVNDICVDGVIQRARCEDRSEVGTDDF